MIKINLPFTQEQLDTLNVGELVYLTGTVYTARDAAHIRMNKFIQEGRELPFDLNNSIIYYVGATPAREGQVIGSAGPTTSARMDKIAPTLYNLGVKATIGKGFRNNEVINSIIDNKAIYLTALGGAGALASNCIIKNELVAFEDLGTEAIYKLELKDFPVFVAINNKGDNIYSRFNK